MNRTRLHRPLLALALLPVAGGIAIASVGVASVGVASAGVSSAPTAHVQPVRAVSRPVEPGDDSGGHDGRATNRTRMAHPEPGHHGGRVARAPEAGDDNGDAHSTARTAAIRAPEAGDDSGGHGGRMTAPRTPEAGDDSGGHGGGTTTATGTPVARTTVTRTTVTRTPEAGDDSGGHGGRSNSRHGDSGKSGSGKSGSDDGPRHS